MGENYAFGTPVMHRISGPVQGGVISERWFDGIWIGLQFSSGETLLLPPMVVWYGPERCTLDLTR